MSNTSFMLFHIRSLLHETISKSNERKGQKKYIMETSSQFHDTNENYDFSIFIAIRHFSTFPFAFASPTHQHLKFESWVLYIYSDGERMKNFPFVSSYFSQYSTPYHYANSSFSCFPSYLVQRSRFKVEAAKNTFRQNQPSKWKGMERKKKFFFWIFRLFFIPLFASTNNFSPKCLSFISCSSTLFSLLFFFFSVRNVFKRNENSLMIERNEDRSCSIKANVDLHLSCVCAPISFHRLPIISSGFVVTQFIE